MVGRECVIEREANLIYCCDESNKEYINYVMGREMFDETQPIHYDDLIAMELLATLFLCMNKEKPWGFLSCIKTQFDREAYYRVIMDFIPIKNQERLEEVYLRKLMEGCYAD